MHKSHALTRCSTGLVKQEYFRNLTGIRDLIKYDYATQTIKIGLSDEVRALRIFSHANGSSKRSGHSKSTYELHPKWLHRRISCGIPRRPSRLQFFLLRLHKELRGRSVATDVQWDICWKVEVRNYDFRRRPSRLKGQDGRWKNRRWRKTAHTRLAKSILAYWTAQLLGPPLIFQTFHQRICPRGCSFDGLKEEGRRDRKMG